MNVSDSTGYDLSTGQAATLACLIEASVPKVGNVHRGSDFEDSTFYDFAVSAVAIGHIFDFAEQYSVGELVFRSVQATQQLVGTNTNLGMILLMAPLAKCNLDSGPGIREVLDALTDTDRDHVLNAIRLAKPGGLGDVDSHDVRRPDQASQLGLVELMQLAKDRDTIAKQYVEDFQDVFDFVVPTLIEELDEKRSLPDSMCHAQLRILARIPDTLITRKCGQEISDKCSQHAERILRECLPGTDEYHSAIADLDFWLRCDGHRRNPGTTADLIAAGLFYGIRSGKICAQEIRAGLSHCRQSNA